jgi:hypothetical protein
VTKKEPCLVSAGQGFSVIYNNRYLFSKYAPQRAIEHIVNNLNIRAGTLFLLCSPILQFPIDLLLQKLSHYSLEIQKSCCILIIEHDKMLYEFSQSQIRFSTTTNTVCSSDISKIITPIQYIYAESPRSAIVFVDKAQKNGLLLSQGIIRRAVRIDCSAATQDTTVLADTISFYAELQHYLDDFIASFWKNRITLTHLGRLFTSNMLKNISLLQKSQPLIAHLIQKPILICAAGCSLDQTLSDLIPTISRKDLYIISVDVTLIPLLKRGIVPDVVISMESQLAIEQAYVGVTDLLHYNNSNNIIAGNPHSIHYICDISSRNAIARHYSTNEYIISFFMTQYCTEPFMSRVEQTGLVNPVIPPLGSVGLAALEIALYLRVPETPIYVSGLDFSYPAGLSHCKNAPTPQKILRSTTHLNPAGFPDAAFKIGTYKLVNTTNTKSLAYYTDIPLSGYGHLFVAHFANIKNLYNLADTGFPLKIEHATTEDLLEATKKYKLEILRPTQNEYKTNLTKEVVKTFYTQERMYLQTIKQILTNKIPPKNTIPKNETQTELLSLIDTCSYLYLHFPDGYKKARLEQDFLNRVRAGVDYYLKICKQID